MQRTLLQSLPEAVFLGTPGGIITYASSQLAALLGYDQPEELEGMCGLEIMEENYGKIVNNRH